MEIILANGAKVSGQAKELRDYFGEQYLDVIGIRMNGVQKPKNAAVCAEVKAPITTHQKPAEASNGKFKQVYVTHCLRQDGKLVARKSGILLTAVPEDCENDPTQITEVTQYYDNRFGVYGSPLVTAVNNMAVDKPKTVNLFLYGDRKRNAHRINPAGQPLDYRPSAYRTR